MLWRIATPMLSASIKLCLICYALLRSVSGEADAVTGSYWIRSFEVLSNPETLGVNLHSAESVTGCSRICRPMSDCRRFCFVPSSKSCLAVTNTTHSSVDIDINDSRCYQLVNRCEDREGYSLYKQRCLKLYDSTPTWLNYSSAQERCSADGGQLFNLLSQQDLDSLKQLIDRGGEMPDYLLLGARKLNGQFYWSDGSLLPIESSLWGNRQPDSKAGEYSVGVLVSTLKLSDVVTLDGYVCQINFS